MADFVLRLLSSHYPETWTKPTPDHYVVIWGSLMVGTIYRHAGGPQNDRWSWSITWPPEPIDEGWTGGPHIVSGGLSRRSGGK